MRHRSNTVLTHDGIDRGLSRRLFEAGCRDPLHWQVFFKGKFGRSRFERLILVHAYSVFKLHVTISMMLGKKVKRYKDLD
jgi:hypothetical protein